MYVPTSCRQGFIKTNQVIYNAIRYDNIHPQAVFEKQSLTPSVLFAKSHGLY